MVKKHMRSSDGMYHIKGKKYQLLVGSRAQVWHGTAYKTNGDLKRDNLLMNKRGRVVSKRKFNTAKKEKRLEKAGYFTKKGKFGFVKHSRSRSHSRKSTRKRHRKKH